MSVRIGLSMSTFPFTSPRAMWRWVETCEESKVDSLWQTDRLVSAEPYLEPLTALAALAGGTSRLKFGMTVLVLPLRDPLVVAKQCATLDFLSNGRFLPAFGVGSDTAAEWDALGSDRTQRGRRMDEALDVIARLWAGEAVTYAGKFYQYQGARVAPLPKQSPLPLWVGGSSPVAIKRTARVGTGWLGGGQTPAQVAPVVAAIRAAAIEAGRPIDDDHYGVSFAFRLGSLDDAPVQQAAKRLAATANPATAFAVGDAEAVIARCRAFRDAGVSKFVLRPIGDSDDDILDQTRRLIADVLPEVHSWA